MPLNAAVATRYQAPAMPMAWNGQARNAEVRYFPQDRIFGALQDAGSKLRVKRNETVFNEGDAAGHAYKIVSGCVRICNHLADGRRQISDFLSEGGIFGLTDIGERSYTAEAVSDVVLMAYPLPRLEAATRESPALNGQILSLVSRKFSESRKHLVLLGRQTAKERLASFFLMMASRVDADENCEIALPMSRQDIADYLGLTIETVCRLISEMRQQGLLRLPNLHAVELKNMDTLEDIAAGGE